MKPFGVDLFVLIAWAVAAACVLAILVLVVCEKRRTGRYPITAKGGWNECGWFLIAWTVWLVLRTFHPGWFADALPVATAALGIDLALLVGFVVLAAYAFSHVFRADWERRWGLYMAHRLVFVALSVGIVLMDATRVAAEPWLWIFAVLIAVFLSPYCARWAYVEFELRQQDRRDAVHH